MNRPWICEYPLSPVPLIIATTDGSRYWTAESKLLEIITATLTTPPNGPKLVISVDPDKSFTLTAAIGRKTKIS